MATPDKVDVTEKPDPGPREPEAWDQRPLGKSLLLGGILLTAAIKRRKKQDSRGSLLLALVLLFAIFGLDAFLSSSASGQTSEIFRIASGLCTIETLFTFHF